LPQTARSIYYRPVFINVGAMPCTRSAIVANCAVDTTIIPLIRAGAGNNLVVLKNKIG